MADVDVVVAVEAGVTGEFSIGTGLVGIPPPLAEAAVFFTYNGTVGTSIGASVVFERPANFIKATLQERQVYGFIKFDIGGRASIAAGVIELKMSASTELKLLGQLNIDAVGSHLIIAGNAKLLIGNVSITYTAAAFWGIFSGEKKWDAVPPYEFPTGGLGIEFANFDLGS